MSDVMSISGHEVWPHAADSSKAQLGQSSCSAIQWIARRDPEGHAEPQAAFPVLHIMHNTQTDTNMFCFHKWILFCLKNHATYPGHVNVLDQATYKHSSV